MKPAVIYLCDDQIKAVVKEIVKNEPDGDYAVVDFYEKHGKTYKKIKNEQNIEIYLDKLTNLTGYAQTLL